MRTLEAEGTRILIPDHCGNCGKVCTDEDAIKHLREWDEVLHDCSFCGKPIRMLSMTMDHVHKSRIDEEGWGVTNQYQFEPYYSWGSHGEFGWVELYAHPACARKGMPYGNFEEEVWGWVNGIPPGVPFPRVELKPCAVCGDIPTEKDARSVAEKLYSFHGPCVYCGNPLRVLSFEMVHGSMTGEHWKNWHFKNWQREPFLDWHGFSEGMKRLRFTGHFSCAIKAMPSVKWQELERAFIELEARKRVSFSKRLRRFLTKRVGIGVRSMFRADWSHLLHIVEATLMDLEGPREWFPGLRGPRLVFEGNIKTGALKAKTVDEE